MCVRELRFTDTPNVSVFYLGLCSTLGAIVGCTVPKLWGVENTFRMPNASIEWLYILGTGMLSHASLCLVEPFKHASKLHFACMV